MLDNKNKSAMDGIDVFASAIPEGLPIHETLSKKVNFDLIVNKDCQVWLAHDAPFPGLLQWIEYDIDMCTLTLVSDDGKIQDSGLKILSTMGKYLRQAKTIDTILMKNQQIYDFGRVPLIIRESLQ